PPPTLAPVSEAVHLRERGEQLLAPLSPTTGTRLRPVAHAGWLLRVRLRSRPHVDRAARSVGGVSEQLRSLAPDGVRRRRPPQPELLRALLPRSGHRRRRRRQRVVAEAHHVLVPHLSGAARFRRRVARRPQRVGRRQRSQRLVAQGRSADRHVRGARRQVRGGARHRRPLPPPHRQIDPGLARLFLLRHGGGRRALRDCLRLRLAAPLQRAAGRVRRARPGHAGRRLLRRRPLRDRRARCRRPAVDREVVGRVPRDGPHAVVLGCGARHERGRRVQVVSLARPVRGVLAGAVPPHPRRAGGRLGADAPRAGGRQPRRELARRVALPDRLPPRPAAGRHRHDRAPPLARDAHLLLRRPPARDRCARVGLRRHGVDRAQPQLADGRRRRVGVRRAAGLPRGRDHGGRARRQCGDGAD
ncbi:hypothetical protein EMIHUDRAFT_460081, partial [Emiliania huxleyi CCMP1516]|uniref:Uncharacterized protein n=2 Tax=Emiliania huxleyi TaxID=2903 RepID=A0A0D3I604_EMIH1